MLTFGVLSCIVIMIAFKVARAACTRPYPPRWARSELFQASFAVGLSVSAVFIVSEFIAGFMVMFSDQATWIDPAGAAGLALVWLLFVRARKSRETSGPLNVTSALSPQRESAGA